MSDNSAIQWTDATWNPTTGCTKVSPGCAHCYIVQTPPFRIKGRKFVNGATDLQLHHDRLDQPRHWRKPRRVFVNSLSDLFHDDVPFDFVDLVMVEIAHAVHCDFQVLTKRPARMLAYFTDPELRNRIDRAGLIRNPMIGARGKIPPTHVRSWPFGNLWLGVSVENQHFADERIPLLLQTPAAVRFISAEPLLGHVDLRGLQMPGHPAYFDALVVPTHDRWQSSRLDWVIVGGESGPGARPCAMEWIEAVVGQCAAASVPVFVKQAGAYVVSTERVDEAGRWAWRAGFTDRKGGDPSEWNESMRVRQFPETRS